MKKFQIFEFPFESGKPVDVEIDREIDKGYKSLKSLSIFTDPDYDNSLNLEVETQITVDTKEVFPRGFDTKLLHPMKQNEEFTHFDEPIQIDNSKVEGRLVSQENAAKSGIIKVLLVLEK
ncbi:MAG: hypothetical protein PF448_06335 [Bacteroidales bacterium]|jgi:hypothetical protein|nr:hypothetical protein [Bacteroidales bacterium]